ncbi:hypothetical protein Hanom_Chr06g00526811 [Helianthus anomalus]
MFARANIPVSSIFHTVHQLSISNQFILPIKPEKEYYTDQQIYSLKLHVNNTSFHAKLLV